MRKESLIKTLILIFVIMCIPRACAETQAILKFRTVVPQAAAIQQKSLRSAITANPETGAISGDMSSIFELNTNGGDESYDFIITSAVECTEGNVSAYDSSGNILFANTEALPTGADVSQALSHTGSNNNVIAYPVIIDTTSPFTSNYQTNYKEYGNCYVIKVNGGTEGTITHLIGTSPIAGTFSKTKDTSGTYRAVVTFTTISL